MPRGGESIKPGLGARATVRQGILHDYRALGLNPGAGPAEIRPAWRQMVPRRHPDLYLYKPGFLMRKTAEDITQEAKEAYGQLYRKKLYRQFPPKEEQPVEPELSPGSSLVYFRDGRVRGWVDRLPRLRVRAWESLDAPSIERFSVGSSRGEVIRAQGAPGAFTVDTYLFGSSAVYFSHGRVSGWAERGVTLRTLDLPVLPYRAPERARQP